MKQPTKWHAMPMPVGLYWQIINAESRKVISTYLPKEEALDIVDQHNNDTVPVSPFKAIINQQQHDREGYAP